MPPTVTPASPTGIHINAIMMLNSVASTENTIPVSYTHLGCANFVDDGSIVVYVNDRIGTVADVLNFLLGGLLYYIPLIIFHCGFRSGNSIPSAVLGGGDFLNGLVARGCV